MAKVSSSTFLLYSPILETSSEKERFLMKIPANILAQNFIKWPGSPAIAEPITVAGSVGHSDWSGPGLGNTWIHTDHVEWGEMDSPMKTRVQWPEEEKMGSGQT